MKKILFIVPLMAMTSITSCGKPFNPNKIDLYKRSYQYHGNKEKLESTTDYEYNDQDLLIKRTDIYAQEENITSSKTIVDYTYDEHENYKTIYINDYDLDGKFLHGCYERYTNQYDNKGRLVESINDECLDLESGEWSRVSRETTEYDNKVETTKRYNKYDELKRTFITTYNDQGRVIHRKIIYHHQNLIIYGYEYDYRLDEYGCAKEIIEYELDESLKIKYKTQSSTISYLENLYYRPLKETIINYDEIFETEKSSETMEWTYNDKHQITLLKDYEGKDEATTTEYYAYVEYEY